MFLFSSMAWNIDFSLLIFGKNGIAKILSLIIPKFPIFGIFGKNGVAKNHFRGTLMNTCLFLAKHLFLENSFLPFIALIISWFYFWHFWPYSYIKNKGSFFNKSFPILYQKSFCQKSFYQNSLLPPP